MIQLLKFKIKNYLEIKLQDTFPELFPLAAFHLLAPLWNRPTILQVRVSRIQKHRDDWMVDDIYTGIGYHRGFE